MNKRSLSTMTPPPPISRPSDIKNVKNVKNKQNNNIVRINRIWPSAEKIKSTNSQQKFYQQSCCKNTGKNLKKQQKNQQKISNRKKQNYSIKYQNNFAKPAQIAFLGLDTNKINNQIISPRKQSSKSILTKENKIVKNAAEIYTNSHIIPKKTLQRQNLRKQLVQQILTQTKQKIKEQVQYQKKQNQNLNKSKYYNQSFHENLYPINLKNQQLNQSQKERIRNLKVTIQNSDKVTQDGTIPIKLVLVGDGSVGKTSMLVSYTTDNFPTDYVPTIFNNYAADIKIGPNKVKLWLWDTAGQQQYAQLRLISYQKADIFFICFSMIDQVSFHNAINKWLPQIQYQCPNSAKIFVGTKSDLHNQYLQDPKNIHNAIPLDYIKKKCHSKKCDFMACSGLNQKGLNEVFTKAMKIIIQKVNKKKKAQQQNCQLI